MKVEHEVRLDRNEIKIDLLFHYNSVWIWSLTKTVAMA